MASDVKHHHWKAPSTVIVLSGPAPSSDGINSKHNISTATYEADGLETGLLRQLQTQSRPPSGTIQQLAYNACTSHPSLSQDTNQTTSLYLPQQGPSVTYVATLRGRIIIILPT